MSHETFPTQNSDDKPVILKVNGPIAELILNNPGRKNALSLAAWQRIPELLSSLPEHSDVRVCVVKGAGGQAFCAGADISEFEAVRATPDAAEHYDHLNVKAFQALKSVDVPVIAAIEGPCLGGGLGIALACDIRIASNTAFFAIPAAKLGLAYPPDAVSDFLEVLSPSAAKMLLFSADRISAETALRFGLIDETADKDGLQTRVEQLCGTISKNAPLSLRAAKQTINQIAKEGAATDLQSARTQARACIDSQDYAEGCRAFLEKRKPVFTGK